MLTRVRVFNFCTTDDPFVHLFFRLLFFVDQMGETTLKVEVQEAAAGAPMYVTKAGFAPCFLRAQSALPSKSSPQAPI